MRITAKAVKVFTILCLCLGCFPFAVYAEESAEEQEIRDFLQQLYMARAGLLVNGDEHPLSRFYLQDERSSRSAKGRELYRSKYVRKWAKKRSMTFVSAEPSIRIARFQKESGTIVRASVIQSLKLTYQYEEPFIPQQHFGVGTRHALKLKKKGNSWFVLSEWYLDPLDENPDLIPSLKGKFPALYDGSAKQPPTLPLIGKHSPRHFNRERAVAYANKYAGAAWGAGNNNRYNRKYQDYTGLGGDCTNFVSQVIGDREEGGGLPAGYGWRASRSGGSVSWVRTDDFKNFILYSGYGKLVAKGTYGDVAKPTNKYPQSAFHELQPGDLVAYEMKGDVDHFAVFIGFDDKGYPLVNCHTADRFRAPFDLGWDKSTKYWLIRIVD